MIKSIKSFLMVPLALFVFFLSASKSYAQDEPEFDDAFTFEDTVDHPRTFAIGLATLKEHGFGVIARLRFGHFAIDGAIGSLPILVMYTDYSGEMLNMDADMSIHADAGCVFFFNDDQKRFQNGIRLAGIYDSIIGPAGMIGWVGDLTFNRFALGFGAGIQYYPDYIEKAEEHFPELRRAEAMDETQNIQLYLGINFMWYLF